MFVYFCSMLQDSKLLESIFCILLLVEAFSLQKIVKLLEDVEVS